jgi:hypothetical protein
MFYSEFKLTPSALRSAMERDGEMSRLRVMTGLRISNSPCASTYITEKKIRNILIHYAQSMSWKEVKKVDRMISRMDKLSNVDLEYLYHLGTEESVSDMIKALSLTHKQVNKLSTEWKEKKDQH